MKECVNLENGLRVGTDGSVTPCCLAVNTKYRDDKGDVMNVSTHTFEEMLNSPTAVDLREKTRKGETPAACTICWREEDIGHTSKRMRDNQYFKTTQREEKELIYLELNLGNICNLACRTCNLGSSSNWKKYHNAGYISEIKTDEQLDAKMKLHSAPFRDESMIWDTLKTNVHSVKLLELYGGEPMMMKKQWEVLKYCVDKQYSKKQRVTFNTNGTLFKKEHIELLKHFEQVDISFSLDGIGEKFEYMRYPGKWDIVEKNIESWLEHSRPYTNFRFDICYTTSIINVMDYVDMALWGKERGMHVYNNLVHIPDHLSPRNIHEDAKPAIIEHIVKMSELVADSKELYEQSIKTADFIKNSTYSPIEWSKFVIATKNLDKLRGENFHETFRDLRAALFNIKNFI